MINQTNKQPISVTGRISSNAPNLQNIRVRDKEGCKIRLTLVPYNSKQVWEKSCYFIKNLFEVFE